MHSILIPGFKTVDHIDRNGLNNQKHNLRGCSYQNNLRNKVGFGKSKYRGVSFHKPSNKWRAVINIDKKPINLGYYDTENDAAHAYNVAAEKISSFYLLNDIKI